MSKRKSNKLTANQQAYSKEINRLKRAVKRLEQRGYRFSDDIIPQMPARVTKSAIQRLQETTTRHLYAEATALNEDTGEIISGTEKRHLERKESAMKAVATRQKRLQEQQKEQGQEQGTQLEPKKGKNKAVPPIKRGRDKKDKENEPYYPKGGNIIADNVIDNFISRLQEPSPTVYQHPSGKTFKRREEALRESERAKFTLLSLTYSVINEIGKEELGWRLQENAEQVGQLVDAVLYGSDASVIASACSELASIINGGALSMQQLSDIAEQEEYNESWGSELYE